MWLNELPKGGCHNFVVENGILNHAERPKTRIECRSRSRSYAKTICQRLSLCEAEAIMKYKKEPKIPHTDYMLYRNENTKKAKMLYKWDLV